MCTSHYTWKLSIPCGIAEFDYAYSHHREISMSRYTLVHLGAAFESVFYGKLSLVSIDKRFNPGLFFSLKINHKSSCKTFSIEHRNGYRTGHLDNYQNIHFLNLKKNHFFYFLTLKNCIWLFLTFVYCSMVKPDIINTF